MAGPQFVAEHRPGKVAPFNLKKALFRLAVRPSKKGGNCSVGSASIKAFSRTGRGLNMAGPQFVYFMKDLSKTYPGGKQVLKNIYLSF